MRGRLFAFVGWSVLGIVITALFLAFDLLTRWKLMDQILMPAQAVANILPGGGMHNPLAIPIGILCEGVLIGLFLFVASSLFGGRSRSTN